MRNGHVQNFSAAALPLSFVDLRRIAIKDKSVHKQSVTECWKSAAYKVQQKNELNFTEVKSEARDANKIC